MLEFGRDYEVLVLDDASTDGTPAALDRYLRVLPLRILKEEHRAGYAGAVQRLLQEVLERTSYPKRDAAILLQADFTENPDYIVPLVKALEGGADVVAGVVESNGRPAPQAVRVARRVAPWVLGKAFGGAPVSDPLSGFRAYRLIVLKKALAEFRGKTVLDHRWMGVQRRTTRSRCTPRAPDRRGAPDAALRCRGAPLAF